VASVASAGTADEPALALALLATLANDPALRGGALP
jgi:hypothetical protein